jgi:hypothetical protein
VFSPPTKLVLLFLCLPALCAASTSEEDLFFKSVADVNDGQLHFLTQAPAKPVHHHKNHVFISDDSLATGWVRLEQCHQYLDPVPSMQIVYSKDRIRNLTIRRSENIGKAWVDANTVQMEEVAHDAQICINAETRALRVDGDGYYSLANGPFMRRFLDGYYPMRVSMEVTMETNKLKFTDITPLPQPGFLFRQEGMNLGYEALFEGRLRTILRFAMAH